MTDKKVEILAPAGAMEQLIASVRAGADAVYLGVGRLNARQAAENFNGELLDEAVAYCHERGVRVHLAMNTLLFDDELDVALELLRHAASLPVDAVIVQDAGLAAIIRNAVPELTLHASTQMTVHNPAALSLLEKMGFSRAILSREMNADEIGQMCASSEMEIEAFVHGALCMSVSGQCYMSAMLGSRSGNRGRCAQPCRLPFRAGSFENCLSLKDMSHIDSIKKLTDVGVCSLKIEGRLKRPEYCAAAVSACRYARDNGSVPQELSQKLGAVFSRSGFTDGYLTGRRGKAMFGSRTKEDVVAGGGVTASLHELYKNEYQRVEIQMSFSARSGVPAELTVSDSDGNLCSVLGCVPESAQGRAIDAESISSRLRKTGGTPYIVGDVRCDIDEGLNLPASAVNAMRREALAGLSEQRSAKRPLSFAEPEPFCFKSYRAQNQQYHVIVRSASQIPENIPEAVECVWLPLEADAEELAYIKDKNGKNGIVTAVEAPRGLFGNEQKIREMMNTAAQIGITQCMVHNIGAIQPALDAGLVPVGGFGLNITNTVSLEEYQRLGLRGAELSMELTLRRIEQIGGSMPRGITVWGRQALMLTRNCPAALSGECRKEKNFDSGFCSITDRKGESFPVMCRMGCSEIFNTVPLSIVEKTDGLDSVDWLFIRLSVESREKAGEIIRRTVEKKPLDNTKFTRGLYYRGVE